MLASRTRRMTGRLNSVNSDGDDYDPRDDDDQMMRYSQLGYCSPRTAAELMAATLPAPNRPRTSYGHHKQTVTCKARQTLCWGNAVRLSLMEMTSYLPLSALCSRSLNTPLGLSSCNYKPIDDKQCHVKYFHYEFYADTKVHY